ncbi:hypothetical protein D9756_002463 [Leucocoprinus leucothites]|uniref:Uncharacterized protein n=1 Tax=Leucocoprinus leucothites TaxID=201217 RepID=A0A8H5LM05_9AGAR|nr:hypothetical protein D9756_002463 [Leucoagaricus leucothites]
MAAQNAPVEIWGKIFELSCSDGGQTGRSLALVSRYIHAVSKPYQYQSIALVGPHAIERFAKSLADSSQHRRVKYLFMSTFKPCSTVLDLILGGALQTPKHPSLHPTSSDHTCQTEPRSNHEILSDMYRILEFIAPTVLNLHILMDFYREETFFPTSFTVLEELSIQGPFYDHYDCNDDFCDTLYPPIPSLRRLYLTDVFTCIKDRTYLAIRHYAPYLTHLRIQCADGYVESGRMFLRQLLPASGLEGPGDDEEFYQGYGYVDDYWQGVATVNRAEDDDDEGAKTKRPHFPETLQRIFFHPGPTQSRGNCAASYMMQVMRQTALSELEKCAQDDPRIILFKESPWVWPYSREYGYVEGKKQWLDSISGGTGGWEDS